MIELMSRLGRTGRVCVTTDVGRALAESDISFICVGTPSAHNGSQDLGAILRLTTDLGRAMREKQGRHVFVYRSTLIPGTVDDVLRPMLESESGKRDGVDFDVCFQPEFLREGSSIKDYDKPPFTVVGARTEAAADSLRELFNHLPCTFHRTSIRAAEMVKYCSNNFHALKITFANEIARLCAALDVDPFQVMDLVCRDTQLNISPAYLRPGFSFGGSCLPKDLRATLYLARMRDVELPMLAGIIPSNRVHTELAIEKVLTSGKRRIGLIGLAFKSGTDDLRESPLVFIAEQLIGKGLSLLVYDPNVELSRLLGANRRFIETHVPHIGSLMRDDLDSIIEESELIIVGLRTPIVVEALRRSATNGQIVLDLVGLPQSELASQVIGLTW